MTFVIIQTMLHKPWSWFKWQRHQVTLRWNNCCIKTEFLVFPLVSASSLFILFYNFVLSIFGCAGFSALRHSMFSSCIEQRLLSSCAWASGFGDFSCCGQQTVGLQESQHTAVALDNRLLLLYAACEHAILTTGPAGKFLSGYSRCTCTDIKSTSVSLNYTLQSCFKINFTYIWMHNLNCTHFKNRSIMYHYFYQDREISHLLQKISSFPRSLFLFHYPAPRKPTVLTLDCNGLFSNCI